MEAIALLAKLANEHGPGIVLLFFIVVSLVLMARGAVSTWGAVSLSNANGRNQIDRSTATALDKLGDSNTLLAEQLKAMVLQYGASMQSAQTERQEQAKALGRTLDRMEGMLAVMDEQKKAQRGMSNTLNEVADRIVPIQTDLRDVSIRTAGMESGIAKLLDDRIAPIMAIVIGMNTQVNDMAAAVKANGQSAESIVLELTKFNENVAKVIADFVLWKDMMFDRDDRYNDLMGHILKALKMKEEEKSP